MTPMSVVVVPREMSRVGRANNTPESITGVCVRIYIYIYTWSGAAAQASRDDAPQRSLQSADGNT